MRAGLRKVILRYQQNKKVPPDDGVFWKTCAWAMAEDLKELLKVKRHQKRS